MIAALKRRTTRLTHNEKRRPIQSAAKVLQIYCDLHQALVEHGVGDL